MITLLVKVMIETIIAQEKELGKIRDYSDRILAQIALRAHLVAEFSSDSKNSLFLLETQFPPIEGLLGASFNAHLKKCLSFFVDDEIFLSLAARLKSSQLIEFKKALMIPLRQSVGSCFASALLIHLQNTDLAALAQDLFQAFLKKRVTRIIEGIEYKAPLSPKLGRIEAEKAMIASPLMKSYEYAVASFADVEIGFSKWNFHEALGLNHEADGGLGKVIYTIVEEKLSKINAEIKELSEEMNRLEDSLDIDDAAFRRSYSIERMNQIKSAAKAKHMHLYRMDNEISDQSKQAKNLSTLYKFFVEQYGALFPHYFQELYDPEMFSEGVIEEDRPAGFRLVYKHGRSDPKVWTYITDDKEYIQSLFDFITITEPILMSLKRDEGLEKEIETIISEILLAIQTPEFLKEQQKRIGKMHKKILKEEKNISPYAYIAGGSLRSLIKSFFVMADQPRCEKISAVSKMDLCFSLIEFLKDVKNHDVEPYQSDPFRPLLICNDTHAFNLLPGQEVLKKAWMHSGNTYSYIRDVLMQSKEPIVFADTNWATNFLAFVPNAEQTEFDLVLTDGVKMTPFMLWDSMFVKEATWEVYL